MESVSARYDRSLRTSKGSVIQFIYGEDGMDAALIERQNLDLMSMKESAFNRTYKLDIDSDDFGRIPGRPDQFYITPEIINLCRSDAGK